MRMARVNVYLPDELAREARAAGLNISGVVREALKGKLAGNETETWLDRLDAGGRVALDHASVLAAVEAGRDELGDRG